MDVSHTPLLLWLSLQPFSGIFEYPSIGGQLYKKETVLVRAPGGLEAPTFPSSPPTHPPLESPAWGKCFPYYVYKALNFQSH